MTTTMTSPRAPVVVIALFGSILMFAGWVLAIVPAFHHLQRVALVVGVAIVGFALVLVPAGLDLLTAPNDGKRGVPSLLISMIPSAALFVITVVALPLALTFRILAIVAEAAGLILYGWAWRSHVHGSAATADGQGRQA